MPNPETGGVDDPVTVSFYVVATDINGVNDIVNAGFKITHPDTSVQQHAGIELFWHTGDMAQIQTAVADAVAAGLLDPAQAADIEYELDQQDARIWWVTKNFESCWESGFYQVMAWASDTSGGQGDAYNQIEYLSIVALELDFDEVDFGSNLIPNVKQVLGGDDQWQPGDPANKPTIANRGNDPALVTLTYTDMVGVVKSHVINQFDARLNGFAFVDMPSNQPTVLFGELDPCAVTKIDFLVHPGSGLPADVYEGNVEIELSHVP
jgi:hypothetical protein